MSDEMSVGVPGDSRCGSQCLAGTVEAGPHSPNPAWGRLGLAGGSCRAHSKTSTSTQATLVGTRPQQRQHIINLA